MHYCHACIFCVVLIAAYSDLNTCEDYIINVKIVNVKITLLSVILSEF